jgi:hypothetical protein
MKPKNKTCDGCGRVKPIWKNVVEDGERKRYCQYCWSAHESKNSPKPTAGKPLRSRSPKRQTQEDTYNKRAREWKVEHPYCEIVIPGICTHRTHDVHHMKGREGDLLLDERYWKAGCRKCHEWVTVHAAEAISLGHSLPRTDGKK